MKSIERKNYSCRKDAQMLSWEMRNVAITGMGFPSKQKDHVKQTVQYAKKEEYTSLVRYNNKQSEMQQTAMHKFEVFGLWSCFWYLFIRVAFFSLDFLQTATLYLIFPVRFQSILRHSDLVNLIYT